MLINKPATPHDYYGEFTGEPASCRNSEAGIKTKFTKWGQIFPIDNQNIEDAIQHRTLSVQVKMPTDIKLYTGGVITREACTKKTTKLYYQTLLVGYNKAPTGQVNRQKMFGEKNEDTPYWITQWAFGESWGEQGYMKIEKVVDEKTYGTMGACKINSYPYYIVPREF